jgi:uncharacterized OsmC-like protein
MKKTQKIEVTSKVFWEGGLKTNSVTRGFEVKTDKPKSYFGTNTAPAPMEVFIASIGACLLTTFVSAAMKARAQIEECTVGTKALTGINDKKEEVLSADLELIVWAKREHKQKLERCFEIAKSTCPLTAAVKFPLTVKMKFKEDR